MAHVDRDTVTRALATAADQELEGESFLSLNAQLMRAYMDKYGVRAEDFAPFAVTAHHNAVTNPNALLRREIDLDGYLASRVVSDPVRLFDASPICDGSAAIVLASAEAAAALGRAPRVQIVASSAATAPLALSRRSDPLKLEAVEASTERALAQARVQRRELDLFELHDAYTIMSILTLESAGFAAHGTGSRLAAEGRHRARRRPANRDLRRPESPRPPGRRDRLLSARRGVFAAHRARAARIRFATPSSRSSRTSAAPAPPS